MNVIGHRGCQERFPENSLAAIRGSASHVDMVEIDIQRCGSGEIVVFHDDELDRLTETTGRVSDTPLSDLSELPIDGSAETIPTFERALQAVPPGTGINVELKHAGLADDVVPVLDELDQDVLLSSFDPEALAAVADEQLPTGYLFADSVPESLETASELGCRSVHPHHELVDEQLIERAHEQGFEVNAWTVPTPEAVRRLQELGADGVIVDSWSIVPDQ